jgi:hypothetical protein
MVWVEAAVNVLMVLYAMKQTLNVNLRIMKPYVSSIAATGLLIPAVETAVLTMRCYLQESANLII